MQVSGPFSRIPQTHHNGLARFPHLYLWENLRRKSLEFLQSERIQYNLFEARPLPCLWRDRVVGLEPSKTPSKGTERPFGGLLGGFDSGTRRPGPGPLGPDSAL